MTDPNQKPIAYDARPVEGFEDPDTGMSFQVDDFWTVVQKVRKHREANKLDASLPKAFSLVLCYVRKKRGLTCDGDFSEESIRGRIGSVRKCTGCAMNRIRSWLRGAR